MMDLRGLLQDPQFRLGLGLLSAAGPRPAAQSGFGQRLGDAMGSYDAWDAQQKKMKMLEEEEKRRVEADKYLAQLRQAQAEKLMRLAGQGLDEDSPSDVKSARTLMTEWNKVYPDNQITYPEALDISKRGPPSFEGMPLRRTKDKSWELAVDDSAFANLAKILAYQKALGTGTGRAETTLVSGTGPDNKPAFSSEAAQLGLVAPRASVQQQPATAAQQPTTADQLPDFMRLPEPLRAAMLGVRIPGKQGAAPAAQSPGLRPIQASGPGLAAEEARLKAEVAREVTAPKTIASLNRAIDRAESVVIPSLDDAEKLVNWKSAGLGGSFYQPFRGTDYKNLEKKINTVVSNIGFSELQNMRFESPTGGALGQVAIQELEMLQQTLGSLSQEQDPDALKKNLSDVRKQYMKTVRTMRLAFDAEKEFLSKSGGGKGGEGRTRLRYNPQTGDLE